MDARLGIRVKFIDPENPANIISAQFATIRGHGEMASYMRKCAEAEREETIVTKRYSLAQEALEEATDEESVNAAADRLRKADEERMKAGNDLLEAVHTFVVKGFILAGAPEDKAEELAVLVGPEQLAELRVKCSFGAGCLDFTKAGGR